MNYIIDLEDLEDVYDAVQTGEIPAKIGDTINGKYVMVNNYHCEPLAALGPGPLYLFTETVKNHGIGETFEEQYLAHKHCPYDAPHLETVAVVSVEITL